MNQTKFLLVVIALLCVTAGTRSSWAEANVGGQADIDFQSVLLLAENGDAAKEAALGSMYMNGRAVTQDYREAFKWYRKAADQGDPKGLDGLGVLYYHGWGVAQDYARALGFFRVAAQKGYAHAEYNVGMMYEYGEGVSRNPAQAKAWYERAAKDGDLKALTALGGGPASSARKLRYAFVGIVLLASLWVLIPQAFPARWPWIGRRQVPLVALGLTGLLYASLSVYGIANNDMHLSRYAGIFAAFKLALLVMIVILGTYVVVHKRRRAPRAYRSGPLQSLDLERIVMAGHKLR